MRKLIAFTLTIIMIVMLFPASAFAIGPDGSRGMPPSRFIIGLDFPAERPSGAYTIENSEYPLYFGPAETGKSLKLYFVDDAADLPYIEANDIVPLLNWFFTENCGGDWRSYNLTVQADGELVTYTRENGGTMIVDFDQNLIDFFDYNIFIQAPGSKSLVNIVSLSLFNDAGEPALLQSVKENCFDRYGDEKILYFGDYGIDLIAQDELYLIPLQIVSDFLMAPAQIASCYFNGQYVMVSSGIGPIGELYYAATEGERSAALTRFGYAELCLALDSLYGLKEAHDIESFHQLFHETAYDQLLTGGSVYDADKALYHIINYHLDDLHSRWLNFSYLTGPKDYFIPYGNSFSRLIEELEAYDQARQEAYPEGIPGYEEVGNTAYITFDHFAYEVNEAYEYYGYENEFDIPYEDTVTLLVRAHEQITREESPIENVVLDLSNNTGGDADAAVCVVAWFLGEADISLKDTFTGAISTLRYRADINLDREFDERDTLADKNLFCLISPVSFSCGNLVPCMFKESNKVTLLGRTSGGGSCVVQPLSTAWGSSFRISGPRKISFLKNGSFYDVDRGADPDFVLTSPAKYYDRHALTEYINSLY